LFRDGRWIGNGKGWNARNFRHIRRHWRWGIHGIRFPWIPSQGKKRFSKKQAGSTEALFIEDLPRKQAEE
jgi:hypothetical protein